MDLSYLSSQMKDELEGAKCYAKNALEIKPMNTTWGKMFLDMANAELSHATNLYKMFEEYFALLTKSYTEVPSYLDELRDETIECYTNKFSKVKYIFDMYNK